MEDWLATLLASAQEPNIAEKLLKGHQAAGKKFKVHLDGYNFHPHLTGKGEKGPRKGFLYFNDDAQLTSLRYNRWKIVLFEERAEGQTVWRDPYFLLRAPKLYDLRMDPFKKANHDSNTYEDWWVRRVYLFAPVQASVANFLKTLKEYPPSQRPVSFNLDQVMDQLYKTGSQ